MEPKAENGVIRLNKSVEDALLFTGILRPDSKLPTPEAAQANRVLQSLQDYPPLKVKKGHVTAVSNPVTKTFGMLEQTDKGSSVSFNTEGDLDRPTKPRTRVERLGTRATINQTVDQIPTARNNPNNLDARYTFTAIQDERDILRSIERDKLPGGVNQRATAYDRMTKGAFKAYPNDGRWIGYGERIDQTRWQPRDAVGRYGKYVNFDPTEPVRQLGKLAAQFGVVKFVPQIGKVLQAIDTVDTFVETFTGVRPTQKIAEEQQKQVSKTVEKRPDYNFGPILPF